MPVDNFLRVAAIFTPCVTGFIEINKLAAATAAGFQRASSACKES
jgi:hypothetical protein